ncbi:MAG: L-lactate permease [Anaerolineaceae bacterium]|nr:L-lactate permease [Anaerolineaceae bacterium]
MPLTFLNWILAFSPVIVVLVLMLGFRWGGSKAGAFAWFTALLAAFFFFGAGFELIAYTQVKAILLSLDVLYIVWTALLLFHIADQAGTVRMIGQALPALTPDRTIQGLLLGWLFASFLQGMGGFGVPVAVSAPLLVGLGFSPVQAVLMSCLGHGWAVNFGSLATSFQTLLAVTNLPGEYLGPDAAWMLGISSFVCGVLVAFVGGGWSGVRRTLPFVAIISTVMGLAQYALVAAGLWTLGATGAAMLGMLAGFALTRLPAYRHNGGSLPTPEQSQEKRSLALAFSAYGILVVLAFAFNLIPLLAKFLDSIYFTLPFPELATSAGWVVPAESGRKIYLLGHPGAILLYSSLIAYFIYAKAGYFKPGAGRKILDLTVRGAVNSSLGIVAMVGMAVLMSNTGMTNLLAEGLSHSFGKTFYPLAAPFLGALGAFITGSNNNSNVLFAGLQMRTAELLQLSVPLILGAQTAGGSLGSVMAPAKVIVGCSTVGLGDNEGVVMRPVLAYGIIPVIGVALMTLVAVWLGGGQ